MVRQPTERRGGAWRALRHGCILAIITLVLLEAVLQLLYVGFWLFAPRADNTIAEGDRVVLCIGDSYTYGEGKTEERFSYPAQLEAILRAEAHADWRVVNTGWPGRNSRDLLERIDGELQNFHPEVVCIVIGTNDCWSTPEELVLPEVPQPAVARPMREPFRLEYRTARLIEIFSVLRPFEATTKPPVSTELIGNWTGSDGRIWKLTANGRANIGGRDVVVHGADGRLELLQDGHTIIAADYRATDDELSLATASGASLRLRRLPEDGALQALAAKPLPESLTIGDGWRALRDGDLDKAGGVASRLLEDAAARSDVELRLHQLRFTVAFEARDRKLLDAELDWMAQEYGRRPTELLASIWLQAMKVGGRTAAGRLQGARLVQDHPGNLELWIDYATVAFDADDLERAREAIDRAVVLCREKQVSRADCWHLRSRIYATLDPVEAVRSAVCAFVAGHSIPLARVTMQRQHTQVAAADLERIFAQEDVPEADREVLRALHGDPNAYSGNPAEVYRSHLRQLIERCRAAGAEPVVATYPFGAPFVEVQRDVVATYGGTLIRLDTEFAGVRARNPDTEYFISDGHCNDAGYAVMARIIADHLLPRLHRG